jgi:hypothetical protein
VEINFDVITLAKLDLKPGQILVAHIPDDYSKENQQELSELLSSSLQDSGYNNTVLVIPESTKLSVIEGDTDELDDHEGTPA